VDHKGYLEELYKIEQAKVLTSGLKPKPRRRRSKRKGSKGRDTDRGSDVSSNVDNNIETRSTRSKYNNKGAFLV